MIKQRKRNTAVKTLLANYCNKRSGKVTESVQELLRRFPYLDWSQQKKIAQAILTSGTKTQRHQICQKLLNTWDDSFEPLVRQLWEQYHHKNSERLVVEFSPLDYVQQHMTDITRQMEQDSCLLQI